MMMSRKILIVFCLSLFYAPLKAQQSWQELTALADSLDSKREHSEALNYREQAIKLAHEEPESIRQELKALQQFSQAESFFWKTRRPDEEAYLLMQNAIEQLVEAGTDAERISRAYKRLSENTFDFMFLQKDAEAHLEKAFEYYEKSTVKDTLYLADMMEFSGFMGIMNRRFEEVIAQSEKGLELMNQVSAPAEEVNARKHKFLYNLSLVHGLEFLNQPITDYYYTLEAEKVQSSMENPDMEGYILTYRKLALLERNQGQYDRAQGYLDKAWNLYRAHQDELEERIGYKLVLSLSNVTMVVLSAAHDEKGMLDLVAQVEDITKNQELDEVEKANYKGFLNHFTTFYLLRKSDSDLDQAKKYNERALAIPVDESKAPYPLFSFHLTSQVIEVEIALWGKKYYQVLRMVDAIERPAHYSDRLFSIKAQALLNLGRKKEVYESINQFLIYLHPENKQIDFPHGDPHVFQPNDDIAITKSLTRIADAFQNHYGHGSQEEEKLYWMAMEQFEKNLFQTVLNKELKDIYDQICAGLMNAALYRQFSKEEHNRLLTFMETLTSKDLVQNYLLKREIAGSTDLYQLVEKEQHIRSFITYLKKEQQKKDDDEIRQQLFEHELELKRVREELASNYEQNDLFAIPEVDIQAKTNKNIIRFSSTGKDLFKMRLYNGQLSYRKIEDYPALKKDIEAYLGMIGQLGTPISTIQTKGAELFSKLFDDDFKTDAHTVIIPDDILHYLPFELLVQDGKYLIEDHTISYAANFYFLKGESEQSVDKNMAVRKLKPKSGKVAFFAPDYMGTVPENQLAVRGSPYSLKGAEEEVNEIARFVSAQVYQGKSATKSKFKALDDQISVLHLAMHSNLHDGDPELSNLLFSSAEEDYEMYISELYGMNFRADLAVLSACNTGVGGFGDGGNLVSMHQAFTTAGIPATIASLWNAPDESTKEIMISFYQNLRAGMDKAAALRAAKLDYLLNHSDENLRHPFYWAAFVLSGDDSPIDLAPASIWQRNGWTILGLSLLLLAGVGIGILRRNSKRNREKRHIAV